MHAMPSAHSLLPFWLSPLGPSQSPFRHSFHQALLYSQVGSGISPEPTPLASPILALTTSCCHCLVKCPLLLHRTVSFVKAGPGAALLTAATVYPRQVLREYR